MKKLLLIISIFLLYATDIYAINVCKNTKYSWSIDYRYSPITNSILSFDKKAEWLYSISKDWIELNEFVVDDKDSRFPTEWNFGFSSNWQHYFYYLPKSNKKVVMVKNWIEGKEYDNIWWWPKFSNNNDLVYLAYEYDDEWKPDIFFVKNDVEIRWDENNASDVFFSPDGKKIVYMFFGSGSKYFAIENSVEYEKFYTDEFLILKYSNDSKHLYYLNKKANWKMWLIRDWVEIKEAKNMAWVRDGIKYIASKDNWKCWIFEDEKELLEFEVPEAYTLKERAVAISPDNKNIAFVAKKDWKKVLFENWIPWKEYYGIFNLMYSPDSKRFAYTASNNLGWEWDIIVLDGIEYDYNYTHVKAIWFSPDSKIFAYDWEGHTIFFNWKPTIKLQNVEQNYVWFTNTFQFLSSNDFYYTYSLINSNWEKKFVRSTCQKNIDINSLEEINQKLELAKNNLSDEYVNLINKTIENLSKFKLMKLHEKLEYTYLENSVYNKNKFAIDYIELLILSKL